MKMRNFCGSKLCTEAYSTASYILNKRWLSKEHNPVNIGEHDSEDDQILQEQEEFERKYNFRFEEA